MAELISCSDRSCEATIKNHRWGKIKADGWLFLKNGEAFCPLHIPSWYKQWKGTK